ncbi:MAG: DUF3656 domain-containing protein [Moorella humiferrea]|nr:DUF3656 domain-containing protein [Moorella humiferrea]
MTRVELMAPAGSPEALKAAVNNGADAVYLGGKQFNAREGAANFSRDELRDAVAYAHECDVRVYVTVNTLLSDWELAEAVDYLYFLGENRVDGIIVQDLGLANLSRNIMPELPLIGSTQMTVTNAAGAEYLARLGFKRVVLGRELSLRDIKAISSKVGIELEVFVHGALCFSYSGQCLFSSMVGGRSGNRGRCAQPCRLAYTLVDEKGRALEEKPEHLLSTRDLYTLDRVPELIAAGVKAFKIEGRMRRPEYVAVVTRAYRRVIDRFYNNPEDFRVFTEEEREVAQIFNRDFTPGYLDGNPGAELMSYGRPSNRGLYLGRVERRQNDGFQVHLEAPLSRGDGLEVWVSKGGHQGLVVHHIRQGEREVDSAPAGATVTLKLPPATRPGDRIFKTSDAKLLQEVRRTFTTIPEERRLPLTMKVYAREGEPLKLEIIDPGGNRAEAQTSRAAEAAERHPLNEAVLAEHLGRLGNTPYRLGHLIVELEGRLMVPLSELNRIRREAIEKLRQMRLEAWPRRVPPEEEFRKRLLELRQPPQAADGERTGRRRQEPPRLAVAVGDPEGARAALAAGAERVYLAGEIWRGHGVPGGNLLRDLIEEAKIKGATLVPALPRIWHETEVAGVGRRLEELVDAGVDLILVGNFGGIELLRKYGLAGWGDYPLNAFNGWSLQALAEAGLKGVTLSPEVNREQLRRLVSPLPLELIVHGALPLMISAHCVLGARLGGQRPGRKCTAPCLKGRYGLKDRLGLVFPIATDDKCRFYLYNVKEINLLEHLEEISSLGFHWVRVEATEKPAGYIRRVTALYRAALDLVARGEGREALAELSLEAEKMAPCGITRGHYFRGVL